MGFTAVGNDSVDTTLMIDKLVQALESVRKILDEDVGDSHQQAFYIIEATLEDYKFRYGKNARRGFNRTEG